MESLSIYKINVGYQPPGDRGSFSPFAPYSVAITKRRLLFEQGFVVAHSYTDAVRIFRELSGLSPGMFRVSEPPASTCDNTLIRYELFLRIGFRNIPELEHYHARLRRHVLSRAYLRQAWDNM